MPLLHVPLLLVLSLLTSMLRSFSLSVSMLYISCVPCPITLNSVVRNKSKKLPSMNSHTKLLFTWMVRVLPSYLSGFMSANQVSKVFLETLSRKISKHLFHFVVKSEFIDIVLFMFSEDGKLKEAHKSRPLYCTFLLQISANKKELASRKSFLFFLIK